MMARNEDWDEDRPLTLKIAALSVLLAFTALLAWLPPPAWWRTCRYARWCDAAGTARGDFR
jgi:hypothetical protein